MSKRPSWIEAHLDIPAALFWWVALKIVLVVGTILLTTGEMVIYGQF